ncbi:hypothetical protein [Agrobacterium genomosp. 2]|uniref:Uncharacterized protein n=1 Tax=Agrobacterium genomosp. 2 str. CFBP 5494 TaxID=1183436 RepID=A0A9W5AZD4_9HYPH|nr:hypothetical protein [Agrobacterium genomosp. 2]CUW87453.1 hypothetical protein AGR2A_Cc120052 [Agrobacterium genomosp. 2 str. CFBP 5494]
MTFSAFTPIEEAIIGEIRALEDQQIHYYLSADGLTVLARAEHNILGGGIPPEIVGRLDLGEKIRTIRNRPNHSGLSVDEILLLGIYPGILEIVVVTPSGSLYRATTHEWHKEDNYIEKHRQTILRVSPELSLMINRGTVQDDDLRQLADRMPRHFLMFRLYELGHVDYQVEHSIEDHMLLVDLGKTRLKAMWHRYLQDRLR